MLRQILFHENQSSAGNQSERRKLKEMGMGSMPTNNIKIPGAIENRFASPVDPNEMGPAFSYERFDPSFERVPQQDSKIGIISDPANEHNLRFASDMDIKECKVYGTVQQGYRADIRHGVNVKPAMTCHQCKNNKPIDRLVFCGHISIDGKGYSTTCTKRYCRKCTWNWYMEQAPTNDPTAPECKDTWHLWKCPFCRGLCSCYRCRTQKKKPRGMNMVDMEESSGALSPARCLSRALLDKEMRQPGQTEFPSIGKDPAAPAKELYQNAPKCEIIEKSG